MNFVLPKELFKSVAAVVPSTIFLLFPVPVVVGFIACFHSVLDKPCDSDSPFDSFFRKPESLSLFLSKLALDRSLLLFSFSNIFFVAAVVVVVVVVEVILESS